METKVITSDIYEATYYFLNGATISSLEVVQEVKREICKITLEGENLPVLQNQYFQGNVSVNLFEFRRNYNRVINLVTIAKRDAKMKLKASKLGGNQWSPQQS